MGIISANFLLTISMVTKVTTYTLVTLGYPALSVNTKRMEISRNNNTLNRPVCRCKSKERTLARPQTLLIACGQYTQDFFIKYKINESHGEGTYIYCLIHMIKLSSFVDMFQNEDVSHWIGCFLKKMHVHEWVFKLK